MNMKDFLEYLSKLKFVDTYEEYIDGKAQKINVYELDGEPTIIITNVHGIFSFPKSHLIEFNLDNGIVTIVNTQDEYVYQSNLAMIIEFSTITDKDGVL